MTNIAENFDIISYLESREIVYYTEGKNVASGWVNIRCLNDECHDRSNHLGINLYSKGYHCWLCHTTGNVWSLIQRIEHEYNHNHPSSNKIKEIIEEFNGGVAYSLQNIPHTFAKPIDYSKPVLPKKATKQFSSMHRRYLENRGLTQEHIDIFDLYAVSADKHYAYRLLVPIIHNNIILSFVARDITGNAEIRYKQCSKENSIIEAKHLVFGLDYVTDQMIICEGTFDAMRIGRGAVALLGTAYTNEQLAILINHQCDQYFILFDGEEEAQKHAKQLEQELSFAGKSVENIVLIEYSEDGKETLAEKDPGDMSDEEIRELRVDLGFSSTFP